MNNIEFFEFYNCCNCYFYDGFDICCHRKNFGTITDEIINKCKTDKLFRKNDSMA